MTKVDVKSRFEAKLLRPAKPGNYWDFPAVVLNRESHARTLQYLSCVRPDVDISLISGLASDRTNASNPAPVGAVECNEAAIFRSDIKLPRLNLFQHPIRRNPSTRKYQLTPPLTSGDVPARNPRTTAPAPALSNHLRTPHESVPGRLGSRLPAAVSGRRAVDPRLR